MSAPTVRCFFWFAFCFYERAMPNGMGFRLHFAPAGPTVNSIGYCFGRYTPLGVGTYGVLVDFAFCFY